MAASSPSRPRWPPTISAARRLGSIIGALYSGVAFGALLGSPVAGYAYDFFGSYAGAILAGAALCLVSFVITLMTPEPREWLARHRRPS